MSRHFESEPENYRQRIPAGPILSMQHATVIKRTLFLALFASALTVQAALTTVENFESYTSSAQLSTAWPGLSGSSVVTLETINVCQGARAMRLDYSGGSLPTTNLVKFTLASNQNWTSNTVFSFNFGGTGNPGDSVMVQLLDQSGGVLGSSLIPGGATNSPCTLASVDISNGTAFTNAANGTGLQSIRAVALGVVTTSANNAGTVYFDNLQVGNRGLLSLLGSSLAKGWKASGYFSGAQVNGSLSNGYGALLTLSMATNGWRVVNQSVPGDNTTLVSNRFYTDEVPVGADQDLIALSIGNEGLVGATNPLAIYNHFFSGITNLIAMSRSNNITPLLGNGYPRDSYSATEYTYLKNMDVHLNTLNVPSVNFLGATDDGFGNWVSNSFINLDAGDAVHPTDAGHYEMFLSIVPSVFDAVKAGRVTPQWGSRTSFLRLTADAGQPVPLSFTPGLTVHSFSVSFRVRSTATGTVASITLPASAVHPTVEITPTGLAYVGTNGIVNNSGVSGTNGAWHDVVITHQYAGAVTRFYVDGVLAATVSERLTPVGFVLGGRGSASSRPASPAQADYQNWLVHRSTLIAEEVTAQFQGALQQASLEVFAPLDDAAFVQNSPATNRAQSFSIAQINGASGNYSAAIFSAAPANLTATTNGTSSVTLNWTDPGVSEISYFVERSAAGAQWTNIATLAANSTNYTDAAVVLGTGYQYRVSYSQGGLRSDYSPIAAANIAPNAFIVGHARILIDLGPNDGSNGNNSGNPDYLGQYWNNLNGVGGGAALASGLGLGNLITASNVMTGVGATIGSGWAANGIANGGLLSPSYALLGNFAVTNSTQDYFYTTTSATLSVTNLDAANNYSFRLFGTRNTSAGGTRVSRFILTGGNGSFTNDLTTSGLNWTNNGTNYWGNNNTIATVNGVTANGSKQIQLLVATNGGGFAYLGILEITANRPPVANNDSTNRQTGNPITIQAASLLANDSDADSDALTFGSFISLPGGTTTNATSITLPGTNTVQTFSYTIGDGFGLSSTGTVTVAVLGVATRLGIQAPPSSTAGAGQVFSQQPVITVLDGAGNLVNSNAPITVTASGGTVQGVTTVNAVTGTATFSGLSLTNAGNVTLTFSSPGFTATNATITVSAAAAVKLGILTQPSPSVAAGVPFPTQPVVAVQDTYGNTVNSNAAIEVSASAGGVLGTQPVNAVSGIANFSDLALTNLNGGSPVTLTFSSAGFSPVVSSGITVAAGPIMTLAWTTQPGGATHGSAFATQPVLKTVDQFGNPSTSGLTASMPVTVTLTGGGILAGTISTNIGTAGANGVVAFTDLQANGAGAGRQLVASTPILGLPVSVMSVWLDGGVSASVQTNASGIVTNWLDQSGNGNHFSTTIGTGGGGIRYTNLVVNGRKAVTFNATSFGAATELKNSSYTNNTKTVSVFVVARKTVTGVGEGPYQRVLATWAGNSTNADWQDAGSFTLDLNANNDTPRITRFSGDPSGVDMGNVSTDPSTNFLVFEYVANSSATNNSFWLGTAGGVTQTTGPRPGSLSTNFNLVATSLGGGLSAGATSVANPFAGSIAEVLIYSTALSTNNRQTVEAYLRNKWLSAAYTGWATTSAAFTVNSKPVTVSGVTATNKIYDGTAIENLTGGSIVGVVSPDVVTIVPGSGMFAGTNVGTYAVTASGFSLGGANAGNYTLAAQPAVNSASITPAPLTIAGLAGGNKSYDGLATAAFTGTPAYLGLANGESFAVVGTPVASFTSVGAGNGKTINVTGFTAPTSNYSLTQPALTGNITKAALSVTANAVVEQYDGLPFSGGSGVSYAGFVNGETNSVLGGALSYGGPAQGAVNVGSYTLTPLGLTATNYTITFYSGTLAIQSAQLTVSNPGPPANLVVSGAPGNFYALEWTTNLAAPDWQQIQVQAAGTNGLLQFTNWLTVYPDFFRTRFIGLGLPRGATLPYLTYEAEDGVISNGAALKGPSLDETTTESEASGREYVELNATGECVQWAVQKAARGMVLRFTIPDSVNGTGTSATLGLYVNGTRIDSLQLTSKFAWQYFPYVSSTMDPSNDPSTGRPLKRFDDARYLFTSALNPGDVVRLQKDAQDTSPAYGIDLIELEPIPAAIALPSNSLNVAQSPYNAATNGSSDAYAAFNNCVTDARNAGKTMYVPPGRYLLSQSFKLNSVKVQGAGIWQSELHFTNPNDCGLLGQGSNIFVADLYLTTETTNRAGAPNNFGVGGWFGLNSMITNLWNEHFLAGAWIGDYSGSSRVTDGLILSGCRFRNTFSDGLNFAKGTKNSIVENSHFRNNGDDAMATWASDVGLVPETSTNIFRFDTVENTYRAAGLAIFGGRGHQAHDCVIRDIVGGPAARFNTVFAGYTFNTNSDMVVSNLTIVRAGSTDLYGVQCGALMFETVNSPLQNVRLSNVQISDSRNHGIYFSTANSCAITNVSFSNVTISGSGQYGIYVNSGAIGASDNSFVTVTNSGTAAVFDTAPFALRKIQGNVGW